jgi:Tfp pilus assembly protein PilF
MQSSTVKREKLVKPLHIAIIVAVFAVAFILLAPKRQNFDEVNAVQHNGKVQPVDSLDLAYLKATHINGDKSGVELGAAAQILVQSGRVEDARDLVDANPQIVLSESERFLLDLELAVSQWQNVSGSDDSIRAEKSAAVLNLLETVHNRSQLQSGEVLQRVLELSRAENSPVQNDATKQSLMFNTYILLSQNDSDNAAYWLQSCGDTFTGYGDTQRSLSCYKSALQSASDKNKFDLSIAVLRQLYKLDNQPEIDQLQQALINNASFDSSQLKVLSSVLLEYARADLAHPLYARLSRIDTSEREAWLFTAAKWAEAANNPAQAVAYLDESVAYRDEAPDAQIEQRIQTLLIAANKNEEALERILISIDAHPNNTEILSIAISLARQISNEKLAFELNKKLLQLEPENIESVLTQVELSLGQSDLSSALRWSSAAVELDPQNPDIRRKHAYVSEWAGKPIQASSHWQWLVENHDDAAAIYQVVRLSSMTLQPQLAATALRRLTAQQKPTSDQVSKLVDFYELDGQPQLAAEALQELTDTYGADRHVLTELANLHYKNQDFERSLDAWQQLRNTVGPSSQGMLARMELNWRLNNPEKALAIAKDIQGGILISDASDIQVRIISELAWRYREHELALFVKPMLSSVQDRQSLIRENLRLVNASLALGDKQSAQAEAYQNWQESGLAEFGLQTMRIAYERVDDTVVNEFLQENEQTAVLMDSPEYWNLRAAAELRQNKFQLAQQSYSRALSLDANNIDAIAGLLWMHIGNNDFDATDELLATYEPQAIQSRVLWAPYALAYLRQGDATSSLEWFDRLENALGNDYGLLLSYADALELAGNTEDASKLRAHAVNTLRPLLAEGSRDDHDKLLQQYTTLVTRYGSAQDKIEWTQVVLGDNATVRPQNRFWREDMAITWLMSTQRHEYARLVMTEMHRDRLAQPEWQSLAIAMQTENLQVVSQILQAGTGITVGDQILAMRQLGQEREAHTLTTKTLSNPASIFDKTVAEQSYALLRANRPSHTTGRVNSLSTKRLAVNERGLSIRHTLFNRNIGYGLDAKQRSYSSDSLNLAGNQEESEIAMSLYLGDRQHGARVTAGLISGEDNKLTFADGEYHVSNTRGTTKLTADLAYNETPSGAEELQIAAKQNRAGVTLDMAVGAREYLQLGADVNDITSRVDHEQIAKGVQSRAEFGYRGAYGAHNWSTSIQAQNTVYDRADSLPSELQLSAGSSMDSIIAKQSARLGLGFSLERGGVGLDFPQSGSPRYFLNASVAHTWPARNIGVQVNAGAGVRVLGGDELGFSLSHDSQTVTSSQAKSGTTAFGVNYRYHF